jgi:hypothetical protein
VPPDLTWVFARADERLTIRRVEDSARCLLVIGDGEEARTYAFSDQVALVKFQSDMEALLLQTGWSFVAFEPDQRTGHDRRTFPRLATDRRRWWTDSRADGRKHPIKKGASWLRSKISPR